MPSLGNLGEATLAQIDRLSTTDVPVVERLSFWQGLFAETGQSVTIEGKPEDFHGTLTRLTAGDLEITSVKSSPIISRSGRNAETDGTRFSLQLVHSGRCYLRHAGIEIAPETGDMIVVDACKPYRLAFSKPVHGLVVSLPRSRFAHHAGTLESIAGRPAGVGSGAATVLSSFIRSAWDELVEPGTEAWPDSASEVVWDLLAALLERDCFDKFETSRAEDLRRRATALVESRMCDPDFRSSTIADELGVSARYLQQVFARSGTTPSRVLLARRLDAAAVRLRSGGMACRVTDAALINGFNDLSYFSRAFRRRFGVSARSYRQSPGSPNANDFKNPV